MSKFTNDPLFVQRSCEMSECGLYRYSLDIVWDEALPRCVFIGLNPSTADAENDDPTIRRCRGFAESWGMGGMRMLNIFAFRATDPKVMLDAENPIGPDNKLEQLIVGFEGPKVACWGTHGHAWNRGETILRKLPALQCFGRNRDGSPKHPLYLRATTRLELFSRGGAL